MSGASIPPNLDVKNWAQYWILLTFKNVLKFMDFTEF